MLSPIGMDRLITQKRKHLWLVTESNRGFFEGPISRLELWYRFQPVNYRKLVVGYLFKIVLLRALIYWGLKV